MSQAKTAEKNSSKSNKSSAIDWQLCLKLANNKTDLAQEILVYIVQQLPEDVRDIKQAFENEDYSEQLRCTHKLHGALCYSGMPGLKTVVAELETLLKKNKIDRSKLLEIFERLDTEVEAVLASPLP